MLYLTDLDHTFLRTDLRISAFSREVWNTFAMHTPLTIATARSYQKSMDFLQGLHFNAPLILLDGTMVVTKEKKLINLEYLPKTLGNALINEAKKFELLPFIVALEDVITLKESFIHPPLEKLNPIQRHVMQNYLNDPRREELQAIHAKEKNLKIVYFGELAQLEPLTKHLKQLFGSEIECKLSPEKYTKGYFLTLLPPKGDKAHALEKVCEYQKCDLAQTTVFGDSINDIGMFKLAGKAVSVANALDELKTLADVVLPHTNDEDAVAHYLQSLMT